MLHHLLTLMSFQTCGAQKNMFWKMICINMRVSKWWYFIYLFIWLNYRISSPNWKFCHQRVYLNAFDTLIHNCLALENWTDNCFMLLCKHSHCDSTFNAAYIHTSLCQIRTKFSIMRCDNMLSAETDPFCCVMKHISSLLTLPCKRERESHVPVRHLSSI